jgi:hypothetical protein
VKRRSRFIRDLPDSKQLLAQLLSTKIRYRGVELLQKRPGCFTLVGDNVEYGSKRDALRAWIKRNPRTFGNYILRQDGEPMRRSLDKRLRLLDNFSAPTWSLVDHSGNIVGYWAVRPTRQDIAECIREARMTDSRPSYKRPETLGWRTWPWDAQRACLVSPHTGHPWLDPELRVESWSSAEAVRGHAGIHACRLPRGDWRLARKPHDMPWTRGYVLGLVERFGKFVLGTEGWRAEWVIVKEILAPDPATARQIKRAYGEGFTVTVAQKGHWLRGGN